MLGKENGGRVVQPQNTNQSLECFVNKKLQTFGYKKLNIRTGRSVGKYAWSLYVITLGNREKKRLLCLEAL